MRINRFLTHSGQKRYVDKLPDFVNALNSEIIPSIKMAPKDVKSKKMQDIAWNNLFQKLIARKPTKPRYKVGMYCRVASPRLVFDKVYQKSWSEEIFRIVKVVPYHPIWVYQIADQDNSIVDMYFYDFELQIVEGKENQDE